MAKTGTSIEQHGYRAVAARIEGRVQGVWYRGWTQQNARGLGLDGWVMNRRDGSVEAVFAGPTDAVDQMLRRCESGPPAARVEAVKLSPYNGAVPPGFEVRPTT